MQSNFAEIKDGKDHVPPQKFQEGSPLKLPLNHSTC